MRLYINITDGILILIVNSTIALMIKRVSLSMLCNHERNNKWSNRNAAINHASHIKSKYFRKEAYLLLILLISSILNLLTYCPNDLHSCIKLVVSTPGTQSHISNAFIMLSEHGFLGQR